MVKIHFKSFIRTSLFLMVIFCSCNGRNIQIKDSREAISECRKELIHLQKKNKMSTKKLVRELKFWNELRDSCYTKIMNDTLYDYVDEYMSVMDSIRNRMIYLALSQERSMHDMLFIKINAVPDCQKDNRYYSKAQQFYEKMDATPIYPTLEKTLKQYYFLLTTSKPFKKEGEMLTFIEEEDRCFRSLLFFIGDVRSEDLSKITSLTSDFFSEITKVVVHESDENCKRIATYLALRANRRVVQNAVAIQDKIKIGIQMRDKEQIGIYRWMLIQPFVILDGKTISFLTNKQKENLYNLSDNLIDMIFYLDTQNGQTMTSEEKHNVSKQMIENFIKLYINFNM